MPYIEQIKKAVNIPVIAVGRMDARIGEGQLRAAKPISSVSQENVRRTILCGEGLHRKDG
jgi:hypothetical protein